MELRELAEQILFQDELTEKLKRVREPLSDENPGEPVRVDQPARSPGFQFAERRQAPEMPAPGSFRDPRKRAIAHHIMANHELQAVEVMAFVLLAFPEAPTEFRIGLARIIDDEQRHTRMHAERAAQLGIAFGELPLNAYIWSKSREYHEVLDYLAGLPLTFENRNLDHSLEFATAFAAAGDERSAAVMHVIHRDEIEHVRFGIDWLRRLKPAGESDWATFIAHLKWPMRPEKARGKVFDRASRERAGLTPEFIELLLDSSQNSRTTDA